jgi:hypothetical protein
LRCRCNTVARCQFISNLSRKVPHVPRGHSKSPRVNLFERYPKSVAVIGGANTLKKRPKPLAIPSASNNETATDDSDSLYHSLPEPGDSDSVYYTLSEPDAMERPSIGERPDAVLSTIAGEDGSREPLASRNNSPREASRARAVQTSTPHNHAEHSTSPVPRTTSVRSRLKTWRKRLGAN